MSLEEADVEEDENEILVEIDELVAAVEPVGDGAPPSERCARARIAEAIQAAAFRQTVRMPRAMLEELHRQVREAIARDARPTRRPPPDKR